MNEAPISEAIVIHPHLLQKFMRYKKDYANLLALYTFYLYHAKQQKTNSILATDGFTKQGMNWALERVKKTKRILKDIGLITVNQKGYYSYIHLLYIYTQKKIANILSTVKDVIEEKIIKKEEPKKEIKPIEKSQFV